MRLIVALVFMLCFVSSLHAQLFIPISDDLFIEDSVSFNGKLVYATYENVYMWDEGTTWKLFEISLPVNVVYPSGELLWIGTERGIFAYDGSEDSLRSPILEDFSVRVIQEVGEKIWAGGRDGLCVISEGQVEYMGYSPVNLMSSVRSMIFWVVEGDGLYVADIDRKPKRIASGAVSSLSVSEEEIIFSVKENFFIGDLNLFQDDYEIQRLDILDKRDFVDACGDAFDVISRGGAWLTLGDKGVCVITGGNTFRELFRALLPGEEIYDVRFYAGYTWLAGARRVYRRPGEDLATDSVFRPTSLWANSKKIISSQGDVFSASDSGMYIYDRDARILTHVDESYVTSPDIVLDRDVLFKDIVEYKNCKYCGLYAQGRLEQGKRIFPIISNRHGVPDSAPDAGHLVDPLQARIKLDFGMNYINVTASDGFSVVQKNDVRAVYVIDPIFVGVILNTLYVLVFTGIFLYFRGRWQRRAEIDSTTGLLDNRRESVGKRLCDRAVDHVSNGVVFSVAFLDIDDFKKFNSDYGHEHGDLVLRRVGGVLLSEMRKDDVIRWGGEEILIFVERLGFRDAYWRMEKIRREIEDMEVYTNSGEKTTVTASIGLACSPLHGESLEDVRINAEMAMKEAKKRGKNQVIVCGEDQDL